MAHSLRVHSPSWWSKQEPGAAGHVVSAVRRQREVDAAAQLIFSFLLGPGSQHMRMPPTFNVALPTSTNLI